MKILFLSSMGQSESQEEDEEVDVSAIQTLYKSFIMECPSGSLYLHEFKKIFGIKNDDTPESLYMDNLFRSFDMNGVSVIILGIILADLTRLTFFRGTCLVKAWAYAQLS